MLQSLHEQHLIGKQTCPHHRAGLLLTNEPITNFQHSYGVELGSRFARPFLMHMLNRRDYHHALQQGLV